MKSIKVIALIFVSVVVGAVVTFGVMYLMNNKTVDMIRNNEELFIPELIDVSSLDEDFIITADKTEFEFVEGFKTDVLSYNEQGYLGKTFKMRKGDTFNPILMNNLDEATTLHWHGLETNGMSDGAAEPNARVYPGEEKTYNLEISQAAATIWYHPHALGTTASQAYKGLAGMIIIEDEYSDSLDLPDIYGVNDIPLVLQAKKFDENGNLAYGHHGMMGGTGMMNRSNMMGMMFEDGDGSNQSTTSGFTIMSNGFYIPYKEVRSEVIRLRLLNGSNHGIMDISTDTNDKINVIATDVGFLENSQEKDFMEIAAGERYEILIDLTSKEIGDEVNIIANGQQVLTLKINDDTDDDFDKPFTTNMISTLAPILMYEEYTGQATTNTFVLDNDQINGKQFSMNTIDETFTKNQIYYLEIDNISNKHHSFHPHNARFLIVEIDGEKVDPKDFGWKDTVYVREGHKVKVQVMFKHTGLFMYHCHILSHEERGMMGRFEVID